MVARWRSGPWDWAAAGGLLVVCAGMVVGDVVDPPAWWEIAAQVGVVPAWAGLGLGALTWRVTADAAGLRVRSGRRTCTLAWEEVAVAVPGPGTSLRIRRTGRCPGKDVLVRSTGLRRPSRVAAEITAMARCPELRPS